MRGGEGEGGEGKRTSANALEKYKAEERVYARNTKRRKGVMRARICVCIG